MTALSPCRTCLTPCCPTQSGDCIWCAWVKRMGYKDGAEYVRAVVREEGDKAAAKKNDQEAL